MAASAGRLRPQVPQRRAPAPAPAPRLAPPQSAVPRPHPGKSFWSPRAGRGRTSPARNRSPLFPWRWLGGEAGWPPWASWGAPPRPVLISLSGFGDRVLFPPSAVNFVRAESPGRLRAGSPAPAGALGGGPPRGPHQLVPEVARRGPASLRRPNSGLSRGSGYSGKGGVHSSQEAWPLPHCAAEERGRRVLLSGSLEVQRPLVAASPVTCVVPAGTLIASPFPHYGKGLILVKCFQGAKSWCRAASQ